MKACASKSFSEGCFSRWYCRSAQPVWVQIRQISNLNLKPVCWLHSTTIFPQYYLRITDHSPACTAPRHLLQQPLVLLAGSNTPARQGSGQMCPLWWVLFGLVHFTSYKFWSFGDYCWKKPKPNQPMKPQHKIKAPLAGEWLQPFMPPSCSHAMLLFACTPVHCTPVHCTP